MDDREVTRDFSEIRGGPFEAAVRKRMGVGEDFQIQVETHGGAEYQLGEYTWDSEPYSFHLIAQPMSWIEVSGNDRRVLMGDVSRHSERQEIEFDSIPDLWAWMTGK